MKYWSFFVAKLTLALGMLYGVHAWLVGIFPKPDTFMYVQFRDPFATDLGYTFAMWMFYLCAVGVLWLVVWDQRYRCRTCLRWLRMPVHTGAWTQVLFGPPRTEYICFYGHGTLIVDELQIHGNQIRDWEPHQDIWSELSSLEETRT